MAQFFWFDGQAPQGPFEIPELLDKPGFGPQSIVCPVGASQPEDWKPAASFEPFREVFAPPAPPQEKPAEIPEPEEASMNIGLIIAAVLIACLCAALAGLYLRNPSAPPQPEGPVVNLAPPTPAKLPVQPGTPIQE